MRLPRTWRKLPAGNGTPDFAPGPEHCTASMPKVLWIELTSKCPYDCVFCTRKSRFGAGRHLDFAVYQSLLRELESPHFIGLNYSGESIYYPRLLEAIELAAATGATTELVTAFSAISPALLQGIAQSRLDRLAISLHTMDDREYSEIYRFGSLHDLRRRIDEFLSLRAARNSPLPRVDFCFVAMRRNLAQLPRVAAYANSVGVREIFIHPIIGRHLVPTLFPEELRGARLLDGFKSELRQAVEAARSEFPGIALTVLNADLERAPAIGHVPRPFGPPLPEGGRIHSCDQNPWETAHILAGGDVVVCEVHDEVSLGNLHSSTLRQIWHGEPYRRFRRDYLAAAIPQCRECPWKTAYLPSKWTSAVRLADGSSPQLLRGWYAAEPGGIAWSKKESAAVLKSAAGARGIRVAGILPHAPGAACNVLELACNGEALGTVVNDTRSLLPFDRSFALTSPQADIYHLTFTIGHTHRPALAGNSPDTRDLGFALSAVEVISGGRRLRLPRWLRGPGAAETRSLPGSQA